MSLILTIVTKIPTLNAGTYYTLDKLQYDGSSTYWQQVYVKNNVITDETQYPVDSETGKKYDPHHYFQLVDLSFNKQMYRLGEINARIHIYRKELAKAEKTEEDERTEYHVFSLDDLTKYFKGCEVTLTDYATTTTDGETIAKGYKITEISPEYTSDKMSMYLNLKIFSPDYAFTTKIGSKAYVAQRLGQDILKTQTVGPGKDNISILPKLGLKNGDANEYLQPYLVQYNESFWDMLIRTANRWGEFVYYEDGKLILGRETFSSKIPIIEDGAIKIDNNGKVEYTKEDGKVKITTDPIILCLYKSLSYVHTTDNKSIDETKYSKAIVSPDYLEEMGTENSNSNDDYYCEYIKPAGDIDATDAVFNHRIMQSFVGMKGNIFDWTLDVWPAEGELNSRNRTIREDKNTDIKKNYIDNSSDDRYGNKICRLFATNKNGGGLTADSYQTILNNEIAASQNVLCLDLGVEYQHLRLGDIFTIQGGTTQYLVLGVECKTDVEDKFESIITKKSESEFVCKTKKSSTPSRKLHFYIHAVKGFNTGTATAPNYVFYPPMLPTGHIRYSGPQRGEVVATADPKMSGRYRVRTSWQDSNDTASPWLRVARDSQNAVWRLKSGTKVLLDYDDGNVELPYIVGVIQDAVSSSATSDIAKKITRQDGETKDRAINRSALFNNMDLTTDAGHAIRLTDREGGSDNDKGGFVEFESSFIPIWGMIESRFPGCKDSVAYDGEDSKYYEGGMELTDKFGVYSIKASTNKRNITIKSPWGDVCLNAFTGITISAPNGDVKIQGKNVSIEAGNNVSIVSGKNITNSILGCSSWLGNWNNKTNGGPGESFRGIGNAVLKSIVGKALQIVEISFIRDFLETIIRPIQGAMTIQSNRYMLLGAGFKDATDENGVNNPLFNDNVTADAWLSSHSLYKLVRENILFRIDDDEVWGPAKGMGIGDIQTKTCDGSNTTIRTKDLKGQQPQQPQQAQQVQNDLLV